MKPITISELCEKLKTLKEQGFGNYIIQVSDDDEMNGVHCLWGNIYVEDGTETIDYVDEKGAQYETNMIVTLG